MSTACTRPPPKRPETGLVIVATWEEFCGWLLDRTTKWPKNRRFTLTQRIENQALDVTEELIIARYEKQGRRERLESINLKLERMRFLFRIALRAGACPHRVFESSMRTMDEVGRMLHGWRTAVSGTRRR